MEKLQYHLGDLGLEEEARVCRNHHIMHRGKRYKSLCHGFERGSLCPCFVFKWELTVSGVGLFVFRSLPLWSSLFCLQLSAHFFQGNLWFRQAWGWSPLCSLFLSGAPLIFLSSGSITSLPTSDSSLLIRLLTNVDAFLQLRKILSANDFFLLKKVFCDFFYACLNVMKC